MGKGEGHSGSLAGYAIAAPRPPGGQLAGRLRGAKRAVTLLHLLRYRTLHTRTRSALYRVTILPLGIVPTVRTTRPTRGPGQARCRRADIDVGGERASVRYPLPLLIHHRYLFIHYCTITHNLVPVRVIRRLALDTIGVVSGISGSVRVVTSATARGGFEWQAFLNLLYAGVVVGLATIPTARCTALLVLGAAGADANSPSADTPHNPFTTLWRAAPQIK